MGLTQLLIKPDQRTLMAIPSLGRALVHRNYRLFLLGQGVSLIGTWMQQVAMSWLVYRLTASPLLLGLMSFSSQLPSLILSPIAGVAADHWNRHRAVVVTQSLAMIQAFLVLFVAQSKSDIVWPLMALGFFLGTVNAFDMPMRQSFLSDMVPDRELLGNAIALNSSIVNGARLIGPSLAGVVIATWGESVCFLLNAVSYVAVIIALLAMRDLPVRSTRPHGPVLARMKEGLAYAFGFVPLRALLLLLAVVSFNAASVSVLMPVFAKDLLKGNASTQGMMLGAMGLGALGAAISLAVRSSVLGLGRVIFLSAAFYGVGQITFSLSTQLWLSIPILVGVGYCMMLHMAASNTLIQTIVEEDKRGRVMSLYTMCFLGIGPVGSLVAGVLAARIGAPATVRLSGLLCIIASILFGLKLPHLRKLVRPIYEAAGILPRPTPTEPPVET